MTGLNKLKSEIEGWSKVKGYYPCLILPLHRDRAIGELTGKYAETCISLPLLRYPLKYATLLSPKIMISDCDILTFKMAKLRICKLYHGSFQIGGIMGTSSDLRNKKSDLFDA